MLLNASQSSTTRFTVSHSKCLTYATVLLEHGVACFPPGFWRAKQAATTNATPALALARPPPIFRCSAHRIPYSVCLLCSTAVVLYGSTNNVFFLWSLQHSDLGWSVCLPTTLCCLLVCHCMFRAERDDVDVRLEQVRRGCMVSAGRSVFALCILVPFGGSGK